MAAGGQRSVHGSGDHPLQACPHAAGGALDGVGSLDEVEALLTQLLGTDTSSGRDGAAVCLTL